MNKKILMLLALAVLAVGCGDSSEDVVVNPGPNTGAVVQTTFLRVAHMVPAGQNYDVYVNDQRVLSNLTFGQFTDYLAVALNSDIKVTQANNESIVLVERKLNATANGYGTLTLTGTPGDILDTVYPDEIAESPGQASIRLVNASDDNLSISLTRTDTTVIVGPVLYPNATNYVDVQPGTYDLEVRDGLNNVVATETGVELDGGANFSAYFYGSEGTGTQTLVVVADLTTQGNPG